MYSPSELEIGAAKHAARHRNQRFELRLVDAEGCRRDHRRAVAAVEPQRDRPQLLGAGHFSRGEHLILEQQRDAGRADRLQKGLRRIEQRHSPVAIARDRLDHALLEPAHRQLGARLDEAFERCDPRRHRFGQQLADGADLEVDETRHVVMAGDETPKLPADDDRNHERRRDPHVLEVLHVNGRHAAQEAERHVEILPGDRRLPGRQRNGLILDIGENADAVALVQPPRDLRDVGCRIAVSEIGLEVRLTAFGKDFAVTLVIETIHHHTVVSGDVLEYPRSLVA